MKYALLEIRRNQYWNGEYKTSTNKKYVEPRLTRTGYSHGVKTIHTPVSFSTKEEAEIELKKMWNKVDNLSKRNFDFEVSEYKE